MNTPDSDPPVLVCGSGSVVTTSSGTTLVDLSMGFGAAFLGHTHPAVTASLQVQAATLLSSGRSPTPLKQRVEARLSALLPLGMRHGGLYSTGMEVAEFAMRVSAIATGRQEFAGFAQSMHGKSAMTAALCWANAPLRPPSIHVLPFVAQMSEGEILDRLGAVLASRRVAALFIEPIQCTNAAREASCEFYERAIEMCREHGTLCIFDEIITGLHRTGPRFYADRLRVQPDILLYAKCLGNGFPATALAVSDAVAIGPETLPGSTFSGNPMAMAAIDATLEAMNGLAMEQRVGEIGNIVQSTLARVRGSGVTLRGRGALWCLEFEDAVHMTRACDAIRAAGLLVTRAGHAIRLLPAVTIDPEVLRESCLHILDACGTVGH